MKTLAAALGFAIVLHSVPARAAAPRESEQSYRELEAATGLDLSRAWASYSRGKRSGSFATSVDRRFRIRRDVGRGFVVAGAVLVLGSAFAFLYGFTDPKGARTGGYALGGASVGLGGGLLVAGAALWGVYARRLDRLERATDERSDLARRSATMPLEGVRFAF